VDDQGYVPAHDEIRWIHARAPLHHRRWWHAGAVAALIVAIAAAAVGVATELRRKPAEEFRVTSGSMQPTLAIGQRVRVDASAYTAAQPRIGDIVAFHAPSGATSAEPVCGAREMPGAVCTVPTGESKEIFVKRVVAEPGDAVAILDGAVWRNGVRAHEPFAVPCDAAGAVCNFPAPVRVPAGHWFLMGDDRGISDDSRYWGPVPSAWIIGKVTAER
jgi:signal peptidase I